MRINLLIGLHLLGLMLFLVGLGLNGGGPVWAANDLKYFESDKPFPNQYLVVYVDDSLPLADGIDRVKEKVEELSNGLAQKYGVEIMQQYADEIGPKGMVIHAKKTDARKLAGESYVAYVEEFSSDGEVLTEDNPLWSLDNIILSATDSTTDALDSKFIKSDDPIPGQYIVAYVDEKLVLEDVDTVDPEYGDNIKKKVEKLNNDLSKKHGASIRHQYHEKIGMKGMAIVATEEIAKELAAEPDVALVVEDGFIHGAAIQYNPPWNLDRIDQQTGYDWKYTYDTEANDVHIYIIDSGILNMYSTGVDFKEKGSTLSRVYNDYTAIPLPYTKEPDFDDWEGHGTKIAGIAAGNFYGVAKQAYLHSVKVLNYNASGSDGDLIKGIQYITNYHQAPAVANISIESKSLNILVDNEIRKSIQAGVTYVVAAGNSNTDACTKMISGVREAITVGATNMFDGRYSLSNYGPCVDVFAPGELIESECNDWDSYYSDCKNNSGTSVAAPHVTGVAALYLATHPYATPAEVTRELMKVVTANVVSNAGTNTPNQLLFSRPAAAKRTAFWRYYDVVHGAHFYTSNWNELGGGLGEWRAEGIAGYMNKTADSNHNSLLRYCNSLNGRHFYTTNYAELGGGNKEWVLEGVAGYVPKMTAVDTTSFYRYLNTGNYDHLYTTQYNELGGGGNGWVYEGVQSQIYTKP